MFYQKFTLLIQSESCNTQALMYPFVTFRAIHRFKFVREVYLCVVHVFICKIYIFFVDIDESPAHIAKEMNILEHKRVGHCFLRLQHTDYSLKKENLLKFMIEIRLDTM